MRKILSTARYVPLTTSSQTAKAPMGTDRYLLTPNISMAAAHPANSATVLPISASSRLSIRKKVVLTPKFSRMRSASVLPVTTPMRATISWTTMSAIVIGMSVQRSE
jgi:hypothetical protein